MEAFAQPLEHDIRLESDSFRPVFRRGAAASLDTLVPGGEISGVVANVVPFGAFVDIGVGTSGLVHSSKV